MSAILFSRSIGPVPIAVVISEAPESVLEITEIPLEEGATATDHAHSAPFRISLEIATESAAITYGALVAWQKARVPFTYVSGFSVHTNLLIERIAPERSSEFSRVFRGTIDLKEVIIVSSASVAGDGSASSSGSKESKGGAKAPGGKNSRRAATPAASRASGASTQDRAAGTVNRGDVRTEPVPSTSPRGQSILFGLTQ